MAAMAATNYAPVDKSIRRAHSISLPKTRKRFYVVESNDGGYQIVNLRYLITDIAFSHRRIIGPFRTFNDAIARLEQELGVTF